MAKSNGKTYADVDFGDLKQAAMDHLWMPFTQYNDLLSKGGPQVIVEGDGIRMTDSDGKVVHRRDRRAIPGERGARPHGDC